MMGLPPPNEYTVILAAVGIAFALIGFISWKMGEKRKAKQAEKEELK